MSTAIFYITENGLSLAKKIKNLYTDASILKFKPSDINQVWTEYRCLIFIMASGIVVRTIAPLLKDKKTDPAVLVLDDKGNHVISLLSGHLGSANKIAEDIANFISAEPVITTSSDINELPSIDLWARENDLEVENWNLVPKISTRLINTGRLKVYKDCDISLPEVFDVVEDIDSADIIISNIEKQGSRLDKQLYLRPKNLAIGIGCNSGTSADEIESAIRNLMIEKNLSFLSVQSISTIDLKGNEPGLVAFANKYNLPIYTYSSDELNAMTIKVEGIEKSEIVFNATNAYAVAEPAALLASGRNKLLISKQKIGNLTIAVAESINPAHQYPNIPTIYIVGTGPGSIEHITPYAKNAIRRSDVIVGYDTYLDIIRDLLRDKEIISTGMTEEIQRCQKAIEIAMTGKKVAVISGGDPGIYAMAGLVFEVLKEVISKQHGVFRKENPETGACCLPTTACYKIEVIPGISALNACAAKLGAPLMHDFACISLSDRLTPWDVIEKRIKAAAKADFVIVLYNPKSKGRVEHINRAQEIILEHRSPETPVGIVKGAMRKDERVVLTDLGNMLSHEIDMQTTVIIGNSKTFIWDNLMITPRGYEEKFKT